MNLGALEIETPERRLARRLAALNLPVLAIDPRAAPAQAPRLIDESDDALVRALLPEPAFQRAIAAQLPVIANTSSMPLRLWPGVTLLSLHTPAASVRLATRPASTLLVAVVLGPRFTEATMFDSVRRRARLTDAAARRQLEQRPAGEEEMGRLAAMVDWMRQDLDGMSRRDREIDQLSHQLGDSYEELSLLYKLSARMSVNQPPGDFLREACDELRDVVGLRWMALQLCEGEALTHELGGRLFWSGEPGDDPRMLEAVGKRLLLCQPAGVEPVIVDDVAQLGVPNLHRFSKDLLIVSLIQDHRPIGVLFGGDKLDQSPITTIDSKLCLSLASSLTMFLENAVLYEDMQGMFMGVLHALTASIDAKDSYTHGHSERVAFVSRELAQATGLDADQAERVYIAGLVHDVGKIGVPERVLTKPASLSAEEFALIRQHPEIGARILEDIRPMQDILPGVLYHHERWDGRGYPVGLRGEQIPLLGRLICLADAFDAMSSDRAYRPSRDRKRVQREIAACAGTQFDPHLTEVFLMTEWQGYFDLLDRQRSELAQRTRDAS